MFPSICCRLETCFLERPFLLRALFGFGDGTSCEGVAGSELGDVKCPGDGGTAGGTSWEGVAGAELGDLKCPGDGGTVGGEVSDTLSPGDGGTVFFDRGLTGESCDVVITGALRRIFR